MRHFPFGFSLKLIPSALLLLGNPALAQTSDLPSLGEVVVTASRIEQSTLEAPASVSVITAEKIEETGAARVTDALTAKVPGFYWRGPTGIADRINTGSTHGLRGQTMTRVKIMLDGVSLADGHAGQNRALLGVEMDDIERIEVVPGVSSALYGSDAIGGVVNIITKVPTKREINFKYARGFDEAKRDVYSASFRNRWENGFAASLSVGYEERAGSRNQNQKWSTTASYAERDPKEASIDSTGRATYLIGDSGAISSRISRINTKVFYELDPKSRFHAGFIYHESKTDYNDYHQYVSGASLTPSLLWNTAQPSVGEEYRYFAGYDGKLGPNFDLKAKISYAKWDYYSVGSATGATQHDGPGTQTKLPTNTFEGLLQLGFNAGQRQYLIVGVSSTRNESNRRAYAVSNWRHPEGSHTGLNSKMDADSRINAFFVQDQIFVTDALTLYAGGRYDRWTTEGTVRNFGGVAAGTAKANASKSAFSPKLAAVYRWDETLSFRASIGKAFHAPTNNDLYSLSRSIDSNNTQNARVLVPDANVGPETARSIDLGVEKTLLGDGYVKAAIYRTKLKDMLYRRVVASDGSYDYLGGVPITELSRMTNAGEARMKGIELSGEIPVTSWLRTSASYSWTDARLTKDEMGTSLEGKYMINVPKNMASLGFDAKWRDWHANLTTTYIGLIYTQPNNSDRKKNVPGGMSKYTLSNLRVGYRIDKNFEATLAVNNLFDKKYYELYLMPRRNVALELRGSF
jgi:iron complex outermembrane receptor protein